MSVYTDSISLSGSVAPNVSKVTSFVGMCNYYSKFVSNTANKIAPPYKLPRNIEVVKNVSKCFWIARVYFGQSSASF